MRDHDNDVERAISIELTDRLLGKRMQASGLLPSELRGSDDVKAQQVD